MLAKAFDQVVCPKVLPWIIYLFDNKNTISDLVNDWGASVILFEEWYTYWHERDK